ncbi:MAG: triose-phosphate isomerase [Myxococcota bacterium]
MAAGRRPVVVGNWKMHNLQGESADLVREIRRLVDDVADVEIGIAPPFTSLGVVHRELQGSVVRLGAQNCFFEERGAYTGEVSAKMLADVGCTYVIAGHSERRHIFNEPDDDISKKVKLILHHGMIPILCVGETLDDRDEENTFRVVGRQVEIGLSGFTARGVEKTIIAYEPVWAIGTGKTATPEQAQEVHAFIRGYVSDVYGEEAAGKVRIQYGGSVKPANAAELMAQPDIDGALVGGASLEAGPFAEIIRGALPR